MPSRKLLIGAIAMGLVVLFLVLKRKPPVAAERAADQVISKGVAAIEAGDIDAAMELVASDFRGQVAGLGTITKGELKSYLARASLLGGGISVTIVTQDDVVSEDLRSVEITIAALLVAGGLRGALESNADAREIVIDIELRDDEWLVVAARG